MIVATVRALKMHGGVAKDALGKEDLTALKRGMANLERHVRNVRKFGVPSVVAINRFGTDTEAELDLIRTRCRDELHVDAFVCEHWAQGLGRHRGAGPARGRAVRGAAPSRRPRLRASLPRRAAALGQDAHHRARDLWCRGHHRRPAGARPVQGISRPQATATSRSASPRPSTASRPTPASRAHPAAMWCPIRELRLAGGAEFLVVICGEIMTMPGLPRIARRRTHPPRRAAARSRGCSRGLVAPAPQGRSRGKHAMSSETAPASAGPWLHGASA